MESRLDVKTLSLFARALYANENNKIKPGQSASVRIKLDEINNAIVIPSITTVKEMGRTLPMFMKMGKRKSANYYWNAYCILCRSRNGLSVGDTLLTTGVMQLRTGMPVRIDRMVPNSAD